MKNSKRFELKMTRYIIMDKDRTVIAKGTVRNRHLIPLSKTNDKKRILYYTTKAKAKSAFTDYGLYAYECYGDLPIVSEERKCKEDELIDNLEAVKVEIVIREV